MEVIAFSLAPLLVALAWLAVTLRIGTKRRRAVEAAEEAASAAEEHARQADRTGLSLVRQLEEERGRAERYFTCISTIERERNEWQNAYETAVSGHANAQAMMLDEIARLGRRMSAARRVLDEVTPEGIERARRLLVAPESELAQLHESYKQQHLELPPSIQPAALDLTEDEARQRAGISGKSLA